MNLNDTHGVRAVDLPPLPQSHFPDPRYGMSHEPAYTADQMREYAKTAQRNAGVGGIDRAERLKILYAAMDYATEAALHPHEPPGEAFDKLRTMLGLAPDDGVPASDEAQALDLLEKLFDAYENGADVYEDPDEQAGHMGHAVKLDDETFHACADLLNRRRPHGVSVPDGETKPKE